MGTGTTLFVAHRHKLCYFYGGDIDSNLIDDVEKKFEAISPMGK